MINLMKHKELLDEQVEVLCTNGTTVKGEWIDWTSAVDNEPDSESITILQDDDFLIELFIHEIKEIQKAK